MGKTADLTVVQKTIIDTLHKESKTQTFIAKEAVHRVLYPSMLTESWVEGKSVEGKSVEGKRYTTNRENRSLWLKQKEPLPSIEYIYSKLTYFPEGFLLVLWSILISWEWIGGFLLNVSQNHQN